MELTIEQTLQQGVAAHKEGKLQEAERLYRAILGVQPKHPDANHNLGLIAVSMNQSGVALPLFKSAIDVNPKIEQFWLSYIDALIKEKQFDNAKEVLDQGKKRGLASEKVDALEAQLMLITEAGESKLSEQKKRLTFAEKRKKLSEKKKKKKAKSPSQTELNTLLEHYQNGRYDDAEKMALLITQEFPENQFAWKVLGALLGQKGMNAEALNAKQKAVQLVPQDAEAHNNLGITLQELGKLEEAIKAYNNALSIKPDFPKAWNNIIFPLQAIKTQISSDDKLRSLYPEDTNSKYAQIEKSILNYKLHLGGKNAGNSLNEALSPLASAENITIKNPAGDKVAAGLDLRLPDKVIAMMHFGRSGTGLLHSLIDGHSEVSTLPSIYLSQYFLHSNWEKIISGGWGEMANRFVAIYEVLFNAASTVPIETKSRKLIHNIGQKEGMANVGDHQNEVLSVDKTLFRAELNHLMGFYDELDAFVFFKLVHAAYDKAINDLNQKNLLFYHIHNPDTYAQLNFLRSAPDGRGLIMVREPVQSCESWSRKPFLDNNHTKIAICISIMLFDIGSIVYHKCNSIGVRLEDIKESPRQTISALCKWMGIKEAESLYEMTAQGKKWWGDPTSPDFKKDGMDPFGKTSINRKVGSIFSEKDQFILRTLYYPFSVRFGYVQANFEQFKVDLQAIRPMLDQMFDFEKTLVKRTQVDPKQFMKAGSYLYLRSGLVERWNTLNEFHTYPNMIEPLRIVSE